MYFKSPVVSVMKFYRSVSGFAITAAWVPFVLCSATSASAAQPSLPSIEVHYDVLDRIIAEDKMRARENSYGAASPVQQQAPQVLRLPDPSVKEYRPSVEKPVTKPVVAKKAVAKKPVVKEGDVALGAPKPEKPKEDAKVVAAPPVTKLKVVSLGDDAAEGKAPPAPPAPEVAKVAEPIVPPAPPVPPAPVVAAPAVPPAPPVVKAPEPVTPPAPPVPPAPVVAAPVVPPAPEVVKAPEPVVPPAPPVPPAPVVTAPAAPVVPPTPPVPVVAVPPVIEQVTPPAPEVVKAPEPVAPPAPPTAPKVEPMKVISLKDENEPPALPDAEIAKALNSPASSEKKPEAEKIVTPPVILTPDTKDVAVENLPIVDAKTSVPIEDTKPSAKTEATAGAPDYVIKFISTETELPLSIESDLKNVVAAIKSGDKNVVLKAYASESADQSTTARRVSLSRVLAVRAFLIENGVDKMKINVQAEGSRNPGGEPDRVDIFYSSTKK